MKDYSELKMLAETATPGEWACSERHDGRFWHISSGNQSIGATHAAGKKSNMAGTFEANAKFIAKANPKTVLALIAEVDELKVDSLCPACEGSGEGWVRSDNGPDAHNIQVDCPECFGQATMLGAYQAMKIQRDSQIERTVKAGGDLLFMRSERDQIKAEVEALRKDAERYQWTTIEGNWVARMFGKWRAHIGEYGASNPTDWFDTREEAIDAAMSNKE